MMNCATIMGRLTADPELRVAVSGKEICRFRVAVDRSGGDKVADFINVVCFSSTANFVARYFQKGSMIAVQGKIQTGSYTDDKGIKRYTVEIVANEVSFCGEKKGDAQPAPKVQSADEGTGYYSNAVPSDFDEITDDEDLPY